MKKVKIGISGLDEMLAFKNLSKNRAKWITKGKAIVPETPYVNKLAKEFHPGIKQVTVGEIIEENKNTKSFILKGENLAPFQAGQYISLKVEIDGKEYARPYTLTSTVKDEFYQITIQREKSGIVSNYMLDKVKVGDTFAISEPSGHFTYSKLRDAKEVVAIAGGSGITPFYTMAKSIVEGIEDFSLIIFYGAKKKEDIIFFEKMSELMFQSDKIKVIYVLSEENHSLYEHGLITKELIDKNTKKGQKSFFVCGPLGLYEYMNEELKKYNYPKKCIRFSPNAPRIIDRKTQNYNLTVIYQDQIEIIPCKSNETLLMSMEKAGIKAKNKCRVGVCGFCRSELLSGEVIMAVDDRRIADEKYNFIHPCVTYPKSDITLKIPD